MSTWTQSDVDNLRQAVAAGVLLVRYNGPPMREVQYQSLIAMRDLLAEMITQVANAAGRKSFKLGSTSKGFR